MLVLILDGKTGLEGAGEGIRLCLFSVIPALFPFLILSMVLTHGLTGAHIPVLRPLGRLVGIPKGAESLLAVGLLGGYPVGAQSVAQLYQQGQISVKDAKRMLGFCSNAGPAFLFGIVGTQLSHPVDAWKLWIIHILSAILVGMILPGRTREPIPCTQSKPPSLTKTLTDGVHIMAQICGWVVLFRVLISFLRKWVLWLLPTDLQILVIGLLELTNGCLTLSEISSQGLQLVLASVMLSFGGLCVMMQTLSVTNTLGFGMYLKGKLLQTAFSVLLSVLAAASGMFPLTVLALTAIVCREAKNIGRNFKPIGV